MAHAKLSPSAASRWMRCPVAPRRESQFPDTSSPAAQWGTDAHEILEKALNEGTNCRDQINGFEDGREKARVAQVALDYVERRQRELGECELKAELKVDAGLDHDIDCLYGTADIVLWSDDVLEVADLKTGKMDVYPDSPQLLIYGYAALTDFIAPTDTHYPFNTVRLTIIQPRGNDPEHIRYVEYTCEELITKFESEVLPAARNALSDNPVAVPSDEACRWCKAAATCRERAEQTMGMLGATNVGEMLDKAQDSDASTMSVDELVEIENAAAAIRNWLDNVHTTLVDKLKARDPEARKHFMLTHGRKKRSFEIEDEDKLVKKLRNTLKLKNAQIYNTKLNSPAAMLKADGLNAKQIEGLKKLIKEETSGMVMVSRTSDKPDAMPVAASMANFVEAESTESTDLNFLS